MKSYHSVVWVEEVPINTRSGQPFVMAVSGLGFNRRLINDQINTVQRTYIALRLPTNNGHIDYAALADSINVSS